MTPPIRVGFVVHVMQVAGAEVLVRETIRRLGSAIVPTVFCLDRVGTIGEDLVAQGVDLVCLNRRPGRDWKVSWNLAREVNQRSIQILHAHQYSPFFYSALTKPLLRRPAKVILTEHGRHYPDVVSPPRRAVNRMVLDRLADAVNACCRFSGVALRDLDGFRGNRIEIIENGIEVDRYGPAVDKDALKATLGLDSSRRYLIHVARHHPVKDQPMLLKGFAAAVADLPKVDLLMVGDGPLRGELEQLASTLRIVDRVKFLGIRKDIPELLRAADAFALTSVSEAASLTLLEAMATGLPVIVTAVGGNPEIVRDEVDGLLVPRGDSAACGVAIKRLFQNAELSQRLGASSRQRVLQQYRLEQTITAYAELYRRLSC
ncbi:N-acetyl-alpha-D-glucosaminyl L-malate synthase BshA [soil metagenome]